MGDMREMRRVLAAALTAALLMLFVTAARAQDESPEAEPFPYRAVTVRRQTNFRRGPSTRHSSRRLLAPETRLRLLIEEPRDGFLHVLGPRGARGWVWAENVEVAAPPDTGFDAVRASAGPCEASFAECEAQGCAPPDSPQGLFNRAKRDPPTGVTPRRLSFPDFRRLQTQADQLVEQGSQLSAAERALLRTLSLGGTTIGEKRLVKLSGFIATGPLRPRASRGESVNCRFTGVQQNDFHITVVPRRTDDEFAGVVVEMIPQGRPAGWTTAKLNRALDEGRRVMVVGGLFYDNLHVVNDDPANFLNGEPRRMSLWEIHPVTQFFVCRRPNNNCNANNVTDWTRLEDF